jgi:hypothetical protein
MVFCSMFAVLAVFWFARAVLWFLSVPGNAFSFLPELGSYGQITDRNDFYKKGNSSYRTLGSDPWVISRSPAHLCLLFSQCPRPATFCCENVNAIKTKLWATRAIIVAALTPDFHADVSKAFESDRHPSQQTCLREIRKIMISPWQEDFPDDEVGIFIENVSVLF